MSRVVGTPLADTNLECEPCNDTSLADPQILTQVAALSPKSNLNLYGGGSYSYIGEYNGDHEIYQATYFNDFPFVPGVPYDLNPNMKLWRIRRNNYVQQRKVITTTTTLLDGEGSFECGISDEPVYAMGTIITFSSNAPDGMYLYFVDRNIQVFCPNISGFYDYYSVSDNIIYLSQSSGISPSLQIHKFNINGTLLLSSAAIYNYTSGLGDIEAIHATGNNVYALINGNTLLRLDKQTLTIKASWSLGHTNCRAIYVVSDNLIYFAYTATTPGIAYLITGTNTVVEVDNSITLTHSIPWAIGPTFPIRNQLHFKKIGDRPGYFFLGGENHPVIIKIGPLICD